MEATFTSADFKSPKYFLPLIYILLAVILTVYVGQRYWGLHLNQFNDCFNKNGIKEIYATDLNRYIRFCQTDDGRFIGQEIVKKGKKWVSDRIMIVDNILDTPELITRIYPAEKPLKIYTNVIKYLLKMRIK